MSAPDKDDNKRPVIIIKKVEDDHDDHHGGVWKIAFADFMTAMMAFFLVMWLINAANEATKAQVASYFNPVKLTAATPARKGVKSIDESLTTTEEQADDTKEEGDGQASEAPAGATQEQAGGGANSDLALFSDPYTVLSEIAGKPQEYPEPETKVAVVTQDEDKQVEDAFRDPFDPAFWQDPPKEKTEEVTEQQDAGGNSQSEGEETVLTIAPDGSVKIEKVKVETTKQSEASDPTESTAKPQTGSEPENAQDRLNEEKPGKQIAAGSNGEPAKPDETAGKNAETEQPQGEVQKAEANSEQQRTITETEYQQLKQQLMHASRAGNEKIPGQLTVSKTKQGVVVSLTDSFESEMFSTSSARPTAAMVRLVDRLSNVLKRRSGNIVISGHTDARPFTSNAYDNWRLSTARAHAARHMLLRGGIPADRIVRVEGHADRKLKNKTEPFASENRRIEILLVRDNT